MDRFSKEEIEKKKKAIFDAMGKRGQKSILKKGYDRWDPFAEPKDPIEMRTDKKKRTSQMLIRDFLQSRDFDNYSNEYARGAFDICMGIINDVEKFKGMYDFSCWYSNLLESDIDESE